jgi:hypothetical protein
LQSNTVTKKNSGSRNLHRLLTAVLFVSGLLQNMAKDSATTLRQVTCSSAAGNAPVETCSLNYLDSVQVSPMQGTEALPVQGRVVCACDG